MQVTTTPHRPLRAQVWNALRACVMHSCVMSVRTRAPRDARCPVRSLHRISGCVHGPVGLLFSLAATARLSLSSSATPCDVSDRLAHYTSIALSQMSAIYFVGASARGTVTL